MLNRNPLRHLDFYNRHYTLAFSRTQVLFIIYLTYLFISFYILSFFSARKFLSRPDLKHPAVHKIFNFPSFMFLFQLTVAFIALLPLRYRPFPDKQRCSLLSRPASSQAGETGSGATPPDSSFAPDSLSLRAPRFPIQCLSEPFCYPIHGLISCVHVL